MRLDRALPLSAKLLIPSVAIILMVAGAVAWMEYRVQRDEINGGYVERAEILVRALTADLSQEEDRDHFAEKGHLQEHVEKLKSLDPALFRVSIYASTPGGPVTTASTEESLVGRPAETHDALPLYSGMTEIVETRKGDEKVLEVLAPVVVDGKIVAALGLYVSLAERDAALGALALRLTVAPAIAVVAAFIVVWLTLRVLVLRRLSRMVQAGEGLAQGEMDSRVAGRWDEPGHDEMAAAVRQFNNMAKSIQSLTAKLGHLGVTDGLTDIYNRRFLDEMLPREVSRSHRLGAPMALLMVDIDHFKRFNDRHGHQAGDQALRGVARTLARHLRAMDFVARYGGEEFAVVLPGADGKSALQTAERLRSAVEAVAIGADGESERLTVSIGAAACPSDANDAVSLVAAADAALYAAKQAGRNTVRAAPAVDLAPVRD